MKTAIPINKAEIVGLVLGGVTAAVGFALLLLNASIFDFMPFEVKVAIPVGSWLVGMAFFLVHRTPDGQSIVFKLW